jgi:Taurine catabolism dioxygenase TauD, TfdA family
MKIQNLEGSIGARVSGLDLRTPLSGDAVRSMQRLAADRGVLVFEDQQMTADEQVFFTAQFGVLEQFPDQSRHGNDNRHVFRVSNEGDGYNVGHYWHMDGSPWPKPTAMSTLLAIDVPSDPPTHTRFLSAAAAYAGLPADLQRQLDGLHWQLASGTRPAVVRRHPLTGQPLLTLPFRFPGDDAGPATLQQLLAGLNADIRPSIAGFGCGAEPGFDLGAGAPCSERSGLGARPRVAAR